jgi:hypothetical protein
LLSHGRDEHEYYPRNLSLIRPKGDDIVEFAIFGRDEIGGYAQIGRIFSTHNINIRGIESNEVEDAKGSRSVASFFCDFANADCAVAEVLKEIRSLNFVTEVHYYEMGDRNWERFFFPMYLNGNRVIIMRLEPLLRIERSLIDRLGTGGAAIMFHEGEVYAEETFRNYKLLLPNASAERMLQCVVDGLRATGWGLVEVSSFTSGYEVKITDPAILKDSNHEENRFLFGTISKILELLFGVKISLSESSYNEKTRVLTMKFGLQKVEPTVAGVSLR